MRAFETDTPRPTDRRRIIHIVCQAVAPQSSTVPGFLTMHFVVAGPEDTLYEGGVYHGKLIFPKDYPLR